jgi:glucosamine-6-phosphate deaminase
MSNFHFKPAPWVPFQDEEVLKKLRPMTAEDIAKHPNPNFRIHIGPNATTASMCDLFGMIYRSDKMDEKFTFISGNPCPDEYTPVVAAINARRINCRNVHAFAMDEWADQDGNIAPITYKSGFSYSFLKYFWQAIDPELRMPLEQVHYPTTENIKHYSDMIEECGDGGADCIYAGPGWAGHIAFIDPCPELIPGFKDRGEYIIKDVNDPYFDQPAQVLTLHPLTIMQNSLHGVFGQSGDIANVPPKAATIGPRDVLHAKKRIENHGLATYGTFSSWQRMTSRLITHGPVTPYVPGSMYQLMDTDVYMSPNIAKPIEVMETAGY